MSRTRAVVASSGLVLAASAGLLVAGPLNPPAGPVAPTFKTLAEVEPRIAINAANTPGDNDATPSVYKITQPGSYYLTADVQVPLGKIGIEIASSDVSIDLGGFTLASGLAGVYALHPGGPAVALSGLHVRNGAVRGATNAGFGLSLAKGSRLEDVTALQCDFGIHLGDGWAVQRCVAHTCDTGFQAGAKCALRDCGATDNQLSGFQVGDGCALGGCVAGGNGGHGFFLGNASTITGCAATVNGLRGISVLQDGVIADCAVKDSGGAGVTTGQGCIVRNTAVSGSGTHGIEVTSLTTVEHCTVRHNDQDGIVADWQCRLIGNTCVFNGQAAAAGAGIRLLNVGSRVEDNVLAHNDKGLVAAGTDNFVARNTARNNSAGNYDIVAGNELAPVVTNPGASTFSTATPWSNFAY